MVRRRTDIWELFRFLDWMMILPEKFELQFEKAVATLEEAPNMRYVTHIERRAKAEGIKEGIKEGIEQGSLKAVRKNVIEILTLRFETTPQELITLLDQITDLAQIKALLRQAVLAGSLEEFEHVAETTIANMPEADSQPNQKAD